MHRILIVFYLYIRSGPEKYCEFLHIPGQQFVNFNDVEKEIRQQTNRIAGTNSGIVNRPIRLTIHSPNVVDLTVVDLPGIVKVCDIENIHPIV